MSILQQCDHTKNARKKNKNRNQCVLHDKVRKKRECGETTEDDRGESMFLPMCDILDGNCAGVVN